MSRKLKKKRDRKGMKTDSSFQLRENTLNSIKYFRAESNRWKQHRRYMKTEAAKRTITFEDD